MKIEYKFVDGTVTEIEVDGSLGEFMLEMKNEGDRVERKETRAMSCCQRLTRKTVILIRGGTHRRRLPGRTSWRGLRKP